MRRILRPPVAAFAIGIAAIWILGIGAAAPARAAGTISGSIFTAQDQDSVAQGASVALLFSPGGPESGAKRLEAQADGNGHFHFMDLPADTAIVYVIQISYRGRQFHSDPIRFAPGQDQIEYNVLLGDAETRNENVTIPAEPGRPARQSAFATVLIVLWTVLIFAGFAMLARRREPAPAQDLPAGARSLVREIAALDIRHAEGAIGDPAYLEVRKGLLGRLRSIGTRKGQAG